MSASSRDDSDGSPLRLAFFGQGVYFRQCALALPCGGLEPAFRDFRAAARPGPLLGALKTLDPDVVVVFRPEIIPPGLFARLNAVTIGYLSEPLPVAAPRSTRTCAIGCPGSSRSTRPTSIASCRSIR